MTSRQALFLFGLFVLGPTAVWIMNKGRARAHQQKFWAAIGYMVLFILWEALAPALFAELWFSLDWRF